MRPRYAPPHKRVWKRRAEHDPYEKPLQAWQKRDRERKKEKWLL